MYLEGGGRTVKYFGGWKKDTAVGLPDQDSKLVMLTPKPGTAVCLRTISGNLTVWIRRVEVGKFEYCPDSN